MCGKGSAAVLFHRRLSHSVCLEMQELGTCEESILLQSQAPLEQQHSQEDNWDCCTSGSSSPAPSELSPSFLPVCLIHVWLFSSVCTCSLAHVPIPISGTVIGMQMCSLARPLCTRLPRQEVLEVLSSFIEEVELPFCLLLISTFAGCHCCSKIYSCSFADSRVRPLCFE